MRPPRCEETLPKVRVPGFIVREADEMKIAQRFSAGVKIDRRTQSPRSGRQNFPTKVDSQILCRPFHGLAILSRSDASAEALGYFHRVRYRGRRSPSLFGKAMTG